MRKFAQILSLVLIFVLHGCQKEIEYNGPGKDSVMVLNGVVENDSIFRIRLERSVFFLSNEPETDKYITSGATVNVTNINTNQTYTLNQSTSGNVYDFPFTVTPNTKFKINVSHPSYPTIESEMTTTTKVDIVSVDTASIIKDQQPYLKTRLTWNDPSATDNYYIIRMKSTYTSTNESYEYPLYLLSNDVSVDNSENTDIDGSIYPVSDLMFNDDKFNGQTKTLEFLTSFYPHYSEPSNPSTVSYDIYLITMNKETYQYYVSMKKNIYMDFFSEPVKVYSNILNGFGIFGTLNYSRYSL